MKKAIWLLLIVFFFGALLISGWRIYHLLAEYNQGENVYKDAAAFSISSKAYGQTTQTGQSLCGQAEALTETPPIYVDFDALCAAHPDITGWLYCQDTLINYPVMQGGDNEYYLNHLYNGKRNKCGSLFVDYRCSGDFSDMHTIIYGHHMKNGSMLAGIVAYKSQEYYEKNTVMYLLTPQKDYRLEIFSGYITSPDSESFLLGFETEQNYHDFLMTAVEKSDFQTDVMPHAEDKVITLSTCTYEYKNARYVVHAILKEMG